MDVSVYLQLKNDLKESAELFLSEGAELAEEVEEDISSIIDVCDITNWKSNIDGEVKDVSQLMLELEEANRSNNRQKCIESIAMLRIAISDVASSFSNSIDSMEELVVSIRDNK